MTRRDYIKSQIDILPEEIIPELEEFINTRRNEKIFKKYIGKLDDANAEEMLGALDECRRIYSDERIYFYEQ